MCGLPTEARQVRLCHGTLVSIFQRSAQPGCRFPRRFNLTNRCVAWDLAEVEAWVEQRRRESLASAVAKSPAPDVRLRRTRPVKAPRRQQVLPSPTS
ncbi:AlpA family transcriptional regulator [Caulobacter sp. BP25]|uniref:helix-turn-helix transcriptional regulator n=1 Tax=Caulobacter sp. BP25 TaxID=2048900 RepID=UPI000C12D9E2|nr:AlpA family phage regulatory protein [Caulobacter sp. BP25]PHY20038.1 transcriptional regulator [Caulobacter sp. BP25]